MFVTEKIAVSHTMEHRQISEFVELLIYGITLWDIMEPCST